LNEVGSAYDASLKGIEISTTPVARSKLCDKNVSSLFEVWKSKTRAVMCYDLHFICWLWNGRNTALAVFAMAKMPSWRYKGNEQT